METDSVNTAGTPQERSRDVMAVLSETAKASPSEPLWMGKRALAQASSLMTPRRRSDAVTVTSVETELSTANYRLRVHTVTVKTEPRF